VLIIQKNTTANRHKTFTAKKLNFILPKGVCEDMDLSEAIAKRRSIRAYKKQALPPGVIEKLIEAARLAPSAGNAQPYEFVIAEKAETKQRLCKASFNQQTLQEAPAVIVVCADGIRAYQSYGERGKNLYCIQDTAAAIQNILLTAYSMGLGTCWIGAFREQEVKKVINAPQNMRPIALISVGYPDESPPARSRRAVGELIHKENF
jgi:nitroreductase